MDYLRPATVLQLGLKLLNILEKVHRAGVVFNDLKMDNIMVADAQTLSKGIVLIDFGLASRYQTQTGEHIRQQRSQGFKGNLIFASLN